MITRLDHIAIAVPNLDRAVRRYTDLGFNASLGGDHPGLGTYNAIIRFGLDYLELIGIRDEEEALASGVSGRIAVDVVRRLGGGLLGFVIATTDITEDCARLREQGIEIKPVSMERRRPDGHIFKWKLAAPEGVLWRVPLPFLIEWITPDVERLSLERAGPHPNGTIGISAVDVAVLDLDRCVSIYRDALGLGEPMAQARPDLGAEARRFNVGSHEITLLAPTGDGAVAEALKAAGEGPCEFSLRLRPPAVASG